MSVREYVIFYVGRGGTSVGPSAGGGNVLLGSGPHGVDSASHTLRPGHLFPIGQISPPGLTADVNDWNPDDLADACVIRLAADASWTLTGIAGGDPRRAVALVNTSDYDLILAHEDTGSAAANRFACASAADVTMASGQTVILLYDETDSRWRIVGGGGALDAIPLTAIDAKGDLVAGTGADTIARLPAGDDGQGLISRSGETTGLAWEDLTTGIGFVVDGGGFVIVTGGPKVAIAVPFACTVTQWEIESDDGTSTTTTVDIKKRAYGGGTATSMIGAGTKPSLSAATENRAAPASWTTVAIAAGDKLYLHVDANNNAKLLTVTLTVTKD